ncbi:MAG: flagellar hook protein FlgE, partial [bacterium]
RFVAPASLTKLGRNLYAESFDSGIPIIGKAGTSGLGRILSNNLELSNVDLAEEFVKMISAQRGFQANSRVITTTDELMQELVNLKR